MRVGVLGSGTVGRAIAGKLASLGHEVLIGTRDVQALMGRTEPDERGREPFAHWQKANPGVKPATFSDTAAHAEVVVNATNGAASLEALAAAGEENLAGKLLIDISNPLDVSHGMPPSLFVSNTDSLAEQIQRAFPEAKVVKSLNTVTATVMVDPSLLGDGEHAIFLSGNDDDAKSQVREILESFGWHQVIDLGDITTARGPEMYLPLWLRLWGSLGNTMFNIKLVQAQD
ncbi:MAG: NADPH-dependent F420 reductase [Actinomycetota bacterium]